MRSIVLGYVTIAITLTASIGCVTSQKTTGFQTNPAVNTNLNQPMGVASNDNKNGIQKFFSSFAGKKNPKKRAASRIDPNDATSLQNRPDVSPELLVVAGQLSLEKHAWESAESYFTRVLKIDPDNTAAQDGLAQVAKARAMGIPSNQNSDANPNNQIKTGAELNQALKNLMPKSKQGNNTFGSNTTSSRQPSEAGLQSVDQTRNILATYSPTNSESTEHDYPSTHTPAPFVVTEPAIEIKSRSRSGKVFNPYYQQNSVMTVAYEEELSPEEIRIEEISIEESNQEIHNSSEVAVAGEIHDEGDIAVASPKPIVSTNVAKFRASLSQWNHQKSASPSENKAAAPQQAVVGESKIKSIQKSEKPSTVQGKKTKVIRFISDDSSSRHQGQ